MPLIDNYFQRDKNGNPAIGGYNKDKDIVYPIEINDDGELSINSKDFGTKLALGEVSGFLPPIYKFARNESITANEAILHEDGADYIFQTSASILSVVSSSGDDIDGGNGARSVSIKGLDGSDNLIEEVITLNGTNPVLTLNSFKLVYSAIIKTSGFGDVITSGGIEPNIGDITITFSGGDRAAKILTGEGQTQMAIFRVPSGYTALIKEVTYGVSEGKSVTTRLRIREDGGAFAVKAIRDIFEDNVIIPLNPPITIPEFSDIIITGQSSASGASCSTSFNIILSENA